MQPVKTTVIEVWPSTNVRSTQGDRWLFGAKDETIAAFDMKRLLDTGKKGRNMARKRQLEKYNAYKKEVKFLADKIGFVMPTGYFAIWFYVPHPKSWRKPKIAEKIYTPHENTPDWDNFIKALFDSLMPRKSRFAGEGGADDRRIHTGAIFKVWVKPEEACIKILEYQQREFMEEFKHGHPKYGRSDFDCAI